MTRSKTIALGLAAALVSSVAAQAATVHHKPAHAAMPHHTAPHARHMAPHAAKTPAPNADHSADSLNAQSLARSQAPQ